MTTSDDPAEQDRLICERLREWGIPFERHDHAPVFTCAEAADHVPAHVAALQTKNLFLRDKKGVRHWLAITTCEKRVDIRALGESLALGRLSFGSPERLMKYLGVTPGSVTLLALAFPGAREVELLVDQEIMHRGAWRCHPMVNTATLVLDQAAVDRFLTHTGHRPTVLPFPELSV